MIIFIIIIFSGRAGCKYLRMRKNCGGVMWSRRGSLCGVVEVSKAGCSSMQTGGEAIEKSARLVITRMREIDPMRENLYLLNAVVRIIVMFFSAS